MKYIFIMMSLAFTFASFGQSQVTYQKIKNRYQFTYEGNSQTFTSLQSLYKEVPEAYAGISKAKSSFFFGEFLTYIGGFMIGYQVGTAIGGGTPKWEFAGIGTGVALLGIPVIRSSTKRAISATDIYNQKINSSSSSSRLSVRPFGFGLAVQF